jgi:hypothetical protein
MPGWSPDAALDPATVAKTADAFDSSAEGASMTAYVRAICFNSNGLHSTMDPF